MTPQEVLAKANSQDDPVEFAKLGVLERLAAIEEGLARVDPSIPVHLLHIHKELHQYEELVHMIPDKDIRTFMLAYQQYKKVKLVEEAAAKKGPGSRKSLNKTTLDDI